MALLPEDQASLKAWNAAHPYEDQYNVATGKKIAGTAKPNPLGGGGATVSIAPAAKVVRTGRDCIGVSHDPWPAAPALWACLGKPRPAG